MSEATRATSARERFSIARRIIMRNKSYADGGRGDLGRGFSGCFEMGDGDEVVRIGLERIRRDVAFRSAIRRHKGTTITKWEELVAQIDDNVDFTAAVANRLATRL